jgi:CRP-like cAMP-binding protein
MFLKYYNKNEYIFRQNEPFDTFYLIYSGAIRLIINLERSVKSKIDQDLLLGNNNKRFTSSRLFELRGSYKELVNYNLMDLSSGDIIGGIEYLNHYENYKYDVKCLTNVEVLKVDLNNFNKILIEGERQLFKNKIKKQMELISDRLKAIKEGRDKIHIKDYILSKGKFTKAFLLNHPISKKNEYKTELLINCGLNPVKIRKNKFKIFHLNNSKISSNIIEEYNKSKNYKRKYSNKHLNLSKDFLTNIGSNNKVQINDIFPSFNTIHNNIPYNHKKFFLITDENKKVDKKLLFNNKTTTTALLLNLKNKKKDNELNIKSNSISKYQLLLKNKRIIFGHNKKIYLKSQSKTNINNKLLSLNDSRNTHKKEFRTINND